MPGENYTNNLLPPIGTSYDELETVAIFDNQEIGENTDGPYHMTGSVTWSVDLYKYVTGAKPTDPDFRQNGGTIYIVMLHHGTNSNGRFSALYQYGHRVTVPSGLTTVRHYPATDTGTQNGNTWTYDISFQQRMPMFRNGGNATFDFDAQYQETFTRTLAKQFGSFTTTGVDFYVEYFNNPGPGATWPITGLTIFKTQDPSIFPLTMNFEAYVYNRLGAFPGHEEYKGRVNASKTITFTPSP